LKVWAKATELSSLLAERNYPLRDKTDFIYRFILKPKDEIKQDLIKQIEQNEKDTDEQSKYKTHFESKQKELEKQLTEMLQGLKL